MSTTNLTLVFPHPKARTTLPARQRPTRNKIGMKNPTRANIIPATDLGFDSRSQQVGTAVLTPGDTAPWPGNLNMVPNAMIRSALFGCTRRVGNDGQIVRERVLASSDQYRVTYRGQDLDQNDCEVWELALAWCRQSGKKIGERVFFAFNDWCRILNRPANHGTANDLIIQSLERLMGGFLKIEHSMKEDWIHVINEVGRDIATGRAYVSINPRVAPWLAVDSTEIDLRRRVTLKSDLSCWLHDYYSTSSTPYPMNLTTLMERSGSNPDIPMRNFRIRVIKAVEELQQCTPPLFAPETRVEKKQNGEYALFVVKATNSRILPVKRAEPVPASLPAPSTPALPPARAVVAKPVPPAKQTVLSRKAPASSPDDDLPVWDRNVDPSDTRSSADRKRAHLRERDLAEAAIYAVGR